MALSSRPEGDVAAVFIDWVINPYVNLCASLTPRPPLLPSTATAAVRVECQRCGHVETLDGRNPKLAERRVSAARYWCKECGAIGPSRDRRSRAR
jgi:predicted RNA-binding Zn-ribbon protein involved in translation (DUF1610 family)